jgi:hypothetical protein
MIVQDQRDPGIPEALGDVMRNHCGHKLVQNGNDMVALELHFLDLVCLCDEFLSDSASAEIQHLKLVGRLRGEGANRNNSMGCAQFINFLAVVT